ncbi:MAG TPA: O-antigen ligase family protein, partial [Verrucomicrobiae bacterium]|nr:O-antigen ligase family protein [Verrucomicrobiae bacterium]
GQLVGYIIAAAVVLLVLSSVFDLGALGAGMLGRDTSLHGRTEIWSLALAEKSNPLIGAGFYSFWSEARATRFMEVYSFVLTQAHNGYLETYLNGGFIALALLFATIVAGGKTIQNRLITNVEWGSISLVFWLIILAHNWSEASFNKLTLLWFVFLMVSIRYPIGARAPLTQQQRTVRLGPQAVLRPNTSGIQ